MRTNFYEFNFKIKIISGENSYEKIPENLSKLSSSNPLFITDKGIVKAGIFEKLRYALDSTKIKKGVLFSDVPQDSSFKIVEEIADIYKKNNCDSIIAIGGGSVIDTAKGVNILVSCNYNSLKEIEGADIIQKKLNPLIAIPTTSGTGSEVTSVAVITDDKTNLKKPFSSEFLLPDCAILDPRSIETLPEKLIITTGLDALSHAIEAFISIQKNPISAGFAIMAIKTIVDNLEKGLKDKKAKFNLLNGSLFAGLAFSNSMVSIIHSIAHAIGGIYHIHHGHLVGLLLPYGLEYNKDVSKDNYSILFDYFNKDNDLVNLNTVEKGEIFTKYVNNFTENMLLKVNLPIKLKELGIKEDSFDNIADKALSDGSIIFNPKPVFKKDIIEILEKAY
jgi:alcohol dehydrogenase